VTGEETETLELRFCEGGRKTALAISPPRGSGWLAYPLFDNCCILVAVGSLPSVSSTKGLGHLSTTYRLPFGLDTYRSKLSQP
jgi:hypothetical protein